MPETVAGKVAVKKQRRTERKDDNMMLGLAKLIIDGNNEGRNEDWQVKAQETIHCMALQLLNNGAPSIPDAQQPAIQRTGLKGKGAANETAEEEESQYSSSGDSWSLLCDEESLSLGHQVENRKRDHERLRDTAIQMTKIIVDGTVNLAHINANIACNAAQTIGNITQTTMDARVFSEGVGSERQSSLQICKAKRRLNWQR
jgi:hypothetical protein